MNKVPNKVLESAFELFKKYGIRSVSMDDIARTLGVSKKTLYQYVTNKADLVKQTIQFCLEDECEKVTEIYDAAKNAIEEMVEIGNYVARQLKMLNPNTIYDLHKYYPESWKLIENHRDNFVYAVVVRNLEIGIAQALYRKNIQPKIVAHLYITQLEAILDHPFFIKEKVAPLEVYTELFKYHIYGIASAQGIEYLKNNIEELKKSQNANY